MEHEDDDALVKMLVYYISRHPISGMATIDRVRNLTQLGEDRVGPITDRVKRELLLEKRKLERAQEDQT